jgi:lipoprotein NlpD
VLALLAGCAARGPAPVTERGLAELPASGVHVVRGGDTLYSIAWRYGLDWQRLARANGIGPPWTIVAGQRLTLRTDRVASTRRAASGDAARETRSDPPTASPSRPEARPSAPRPSRPAPSTPAAPTGPVDWAWPLQAPVTAAFGSGATPNKGIDLRGEAGARVRTAAAGEVVYAGTGLRGHEALVIVKHDDTWLSAYAYNDGIRVREGQRLEAGAEIARLTGEDARARALHFEIRRDGKPVDPVGLLPRR